MTPQEEKLITEWITDARTLLHCHFTKSDLLRKQYKIIGISSATLSALAGSTIFLSIGIQINLWLQVLIGLISLVATILTSIIVFLNLPEIAERHQRSGNEFATIRKDLELLLSLNEIDNSKLRIELDKIKTIWDNTRNNSIPISTIDLKRSKLKSHSLDEF